MIGHKDYSFGRMFVRALLPSPLSAIICLGASLLLVFAYMVMQSVSLGTSLPGWFDGEWSVSYTNNVVRPLLTFFTDFKTENALVVLGWGALGLVVYMLVEFGGRTIGDLRSAQRNIQLTDRAVLHHVGLKSFFAEAFWRLGVLVVFSSVFALGVGPVLHELSAIAPRAVLGDLARQEWPQLLLLTGELALLLHAVVVFLRLFLSRVRLTGDDPI